MRGANPEDAHRGGRVSTRIVAIAGGAPDSSDSRVLPILGPSKSRKVPLRGHVECGKAHCRGWGSIRFSGGGIVFMQRTVCGRSRRSVTVLPDEDRCGERGLQRKRPVDQSLCPLIAESLGDPFHATVYRSSFQRLGGEATCGRPHGDWRWLLVFSRDFQIVLIRSIAPACFRGMRRRFQSSGTRLRRIHT